MKKITFLTIAFLIGFGAAQTSAQFNIKIPKIGKPKTEQPKTEQPTTNDDANQNSSKKSGGDSPAYMAKPRPTNVPVLLKHTIEVKPYRGTTYWKTPNERDHSSWMPLIRFGLFYDQSETIRYNVEWLNPDGSLWFSQPLEDNQTRFSSEIFDTKSTDAAGTYGFRLVNPKTKEIVYQGKFSVKKMPLFPGDPKLKNTATFYTDNDWILPYGYVGFEDSASWDKDPQPTVYMWFKGGVKREDLEARLAWKDFLVDNAKNARLNNPNGWFTRDKPGEYAIKVYYNGEPIRETKFTIDAKGWIARNAFSEQIFLNDHRVVVPVKVVGNMEKWNAATWKTDAFYGNPLNGFVAP